MNANTLETGPHATLKRNLVRLALGAAAGAIVGLAAGALFAERGSIELLDALGWSDILALATALMLVVSGLAVLFATRSRQALAKALRTEGPVAAGEPAELGRQGVLLVLAGALLAAAPVGVLMGNPRPMALFGLLMIVFALQSWLNLRLWRNGDEMIRRTVLETAALCFWACQAALFVWAVAERLGLFPALTSWELLTVLMAAYLVCSMIIGLRRGLS
jgi:hypothetical protein